jgi:hypothetical protein
MWRGRPFQIVGIIASVRRPTPPANVYIPLDVAQKLSGAGDVVSTMYVQASSSDRIAAISPRSRPPTPTATVSSQSDLASTVSGSLASASSLILNLGTWLSIIVLVVAVALAVLFRISGISRRTRELGAEGHRVVQRVWSARWRGVWSRPSSAVSSAWRSASSAR